MQNQQLRADFFDHIGVLAAILAGEGKYMVHPPIIQPLLSVVVMFFAFWR